MEGHQIMITLDSKNVAQKSPCFFLLSTPLPYPRVRHQRLGQNMEPPLSGNHLLSFSPFLHQPPLPSQLRLVDLSGRGACQIRLCLCLLSRPTLYSTPIPHGACGGPGDPPSSWTSHGSPTTSLLHLHPVHHLFLVICMATLCA